MHPIFLPIVNYTPEDTTWWGTIWARWVQGMRHALGIAEMVFYLSQLPVECMNRPFGEACYLIARGAPLMYKMLSIHIIMVGAKTRRAAAHDRPPRAHLFRRRPRA